MTETDNWPRMVQLAWIMCDEAGNRLESRNAIVKPEGYTIPEEVSKLHGITTAMALKDGLPLQEVLEDLRSRWKRRMCWWGIISVSTSVLWERSSSGCG